jgi:hypothetical protein
MPVQPLTLSCHCGKIKLVLPRVPRSLTQCNCSICRRYGALWAYYRRRSVRVEGGKSALATYSWRNRVREYHRCKGCGCVTHYQYRSRKLADGSDTVAVNLRNVDDPERVAHVPIKLLDGARTWRTLAEQPQPGLLGGLRAAPQPLTRLDDAQSSREGPGR